MNALEVCPQCGAPLDPAAPGGICPRCLIKTGLASDAESISNAGATTPHTPVTGSGRRFEPPTPQELAPRFPQLEILNLIGSGGMGAVYRARQRELDRIVALKILPPQLGEDGAFAERFTREARAMARLSHPHIVGIFDFGRTAAAPGSQGNAALYYLVMEYVDGGNLRRLIKGGEVDPSRAITITSQICDALEYAHSEGVVHRDIKPENILVDKSGRVRIADFGLAKIVLDAAHEASLTGTRELLGTFRYMAPEQLEGSKVVDHRADIYAVGVLLYELLTGEVPMGRYYAPSEKSNSDPRIDAVVLRALERAPESRFQSAGEVRRSLASIESLGSPSQEYSTTASRWLTGSFTGIWSASTHPASGWVVACRLLGMLVAFAGVMVACFTTWQSITINIADRGSIARQTLQGWQVWPGKLAALAFALIAIHLMTNLHRLRSLAATYVAFFVAAFSAIALSVWSMNAPLRIVDAPVVWESDGRWVDGHGAGTDEVTPQQGTPSGTRSVLEKMVPSESLSNATPAHALSNQKLIELLVTRGELTIGSSYWADGPYAGLSLGIALAFVGLLEFVFTYAAAPTRRLLTAARSSISSSSGDALANAAAAEPRISKMAVLAAVLGLFPMIPLVFLGGVGVDLLRKDYTSSDEIVIPIGFLIGMSIVPVTVGLFALYRIRRSRGRLHGLPLAFAASLTWPLVVADVIVITVTYIAADRDASAFAVLFLALGCNVLAFVYGWRAVKRPLETAN